VQAEKKDFVKKYFLESILDEVIYKWGLLVGKLVFNTNILGSSPTFHNVCFII